MIVRGKITGRIGQISDDKFDPRLYEVVDQPSQPTTLAQKIGSIPKTLAQPFINTGQRVGAAGDSVLMALLSNKAQKARSSGYTSRAEELENILARPRATDFKKAQDFLQIAKDSAAMLSWGMPAGTVGQGLKTGAVSGFGYSPETSLGGLLGSTALGAGTGAATSAILGKLFPGKEKITTIADEGVTKTSGPIKKFASNLERTSQAKMVGGNLNKFGGEKTLKSAEDFGIKIGSKGIKNADELASKAGNLLRTNSDEIQMGLRSLEQQGVKIDTKKVVGAMDEVISKQSLPSVKRVMERAKKDVIAGMGDGSPVNMYQTKYNTFAKSKYGIFSGIEPEASTIYQKANSALNSSLDDAFKQSGIESLRQNNKAISTAMELLGWADDANSKLGKSPVGMFEILSLSTGLSGGGIPGAIANIGTQKVLTSPNIQYGASQVLKKIMGEGTKPSLGKNLPAVLETKVGSKLPTALSGLTASGGQQQAPTGGMESMPDAGTTQPSNALGISQEQLALLSLLPEKEASNVLVSLIKDRIIGGKDEKTAAKEYMLSSAQKALSMLDQGGINTGLVAGPGTELMAKLGVGADQRTLDFNNIINNLYATIGRQRGGTSFTASEQKLLDKYLPRVGQSQQTLRTNLMGLIQELPTMD